MSAKKSKVKKSRAGRSGTIIAISILGIIAIAAVFVIILFNNTGQTSGDTEPEVCADTDPSEDAASDDLEPDELTVSKSDISETSFSIPADVSEYAALVPPLKDGYSEFVGPWAYIFYAKDDHTDYVYHNAYDDYIPKAGDLLITGNDEDLLYIDRSSKKTITGLGRFMYWFDDYAWNGHILYIAEVEGDILTCYEGNTIAPGQALDPEDPDYIYKSSVDMVQIRYSTGETLTVDKPEEKEIRAVIETGFPEVLVAAVNYTAQNLLDDFTENAAEVRSAVMSLYPEGIDWCGLFIHYLLLKSVS